MVFVVEDLCLFVYLPDNFLVSGAKNIEGVQKTARCIRNW